jgi:hypothetical protein
MVAVRVEVAGTESTEVALSVRGKVENVRSKWALLVPNLVSVPYSDNISLLVLLKIMIEQMDDWRASTLGEMYMNVNIINAVAPNFTFDVRKLISIGITNASNTVVRAAESLRDQIDDWEKLFPNILAATTVGQNTKMSQAIDEMVTPGIARLPFMSLNNSNWYKSYNRIDADNELIANLRTLAVYSDTFDRIKTGRHGTGDLTVSLHDSTFYHNESTTPSVPDFRMVKGSDRAGVGIIALPSVALDKPGGVAAPMIPDTLIEAFAVGGFTLYGMLSVLNFDTHLTVTNNSLSVVSATHATSRKFYIEGTPTTSPTKTVVLRFGGEDHVYDVPPEGLPVSIYLPSDDASIYYVAAGSTLGDITTTTNANGFIMEYDYATSDTGSAFINKTLWKSLSDDSLRLGDLIGKAAVPPNFPTSLDSFLDLVVQYSRYIATTTNIGSSLYGALQNEAYRRNMASASKLPFSCLRLDWYYVPSDLFSIEELKTLYCYYLSILPGVGIAIANDVAFHSWLQKQCA